MTSEIYLPQPPFFVHYDGSKIAFNILSQNSPPFNDINKSLELSLTLGIIIPFFALVGYLADT